MTSLTFRRSMWPCGLSLLCIMLGSTVSGLHSISHPLWVPSLRPLLKRSLQTECPAPHSGLSHSTKSGSAPSPPESLHGLLGLEALSPSILCHS